MRDRDRRDTTELADSRHCRVVDERDAVPEKTLYEERALSDRERRFSSDPVEIRLDFLEPVAVVTSELGHRRPALAFVTDVLAVVELDGDALAVVRDGPDTLRCLVGGDHAFEPRRERGADLPAPRGGLGQDVLDPIDEPAQLIRVVF